MSIHAGGVKKYIVRLSSEERKYLKTIIGTGRGLCVIKKLKNQHS